MTEMTEQAPSHCYSCGHPWDSHEQNPDGTRSCRSVGHPKGIPCSDCRAMLTTEYRAQLQDERDADWFRAVWGAYTVTLSDARNAFGTSAPAFFSDIHQSALASALIAYRQQQEAALKAALELVRDFVDPNSCTYDNLGYCETHGLPVGTNPTCTHARARSLLAGLENKEPA